jgi:Mrp family chromosome partitioning ATPase/intein/homing endonuclease
MPTEKEVLEALASVKDPELGKDVVTLHMIEGIEVDGGKVTFTLNLTTPACPLRTRLEQSAKEAVANIPGVDAVEMKTGANVAATRDYASAEMLKGVKNIVAVASGKGGVGKSTVAVNLAVALASSGAKVGLLDADVYGPNIPLMMGVDKPPEVKDSLIIPPVAHGVKIASLGFFYDEKTPVIWRGPLVAGAVRQLLTQVDWGDLDYLVCDLPPGCLPAGTLVMTGNNSPKPIEQIKPGEFVMSFNGKELVPRRVLGVVPQGKQKVFKLVTPNRTIIASANHPFLKYQWTGRYDWRELARLEPRDRILVSNCVEGGVPMNLPVVNPGRKKITIPASTTNAFMRIVGHFVGDGFVKHLRGSGRQRELRICEPEGSKYREAYESMYGEVFGVKTFNDNGGLKFAVSSAPLVELFTSLDLVHHAREKTVPDWVFSLPLDQRRSFVIGYAQADGHPRHREEQKILTDSRSGTKLISLVQDTVSIASTNEILVRRLHELCLMSGFRATNVRSRVRKGNRLKTGRFIGPSPQFEFDFSMKTDRSKFKLARVIRIEPLGSVETYDLQVDEYHNFVANSIVVHNTGDASLTLAQTVPLGGVIIITTPQEAALSIAAKALAMFKRLNVPILGVAENMSYFVCPHCGERTDIFSSGGGKKIAAQRGVEFLGEIPISMAVREGSDAGAPVVSARPDAPESLVYKELAFRVAGMVSIVAFAKTGK